MERLGVVRSHFPVHAQQVAAGEELSMAPKPVLPVRRCPSARTPCSEPRGLPNEV